MFVSFCEPCLNLENRQRLFRENNEPKGDDGAMDAGALCDGSKL
jgi:hypothetical protein